MDEPIDESYFNWLCAKLLDVRIPNYWELMRILNRTEFVWVIVGDQNRAEDGLELREDFLRETQLENDQDWFNLPCSLLEMFVAFSRRANFQTDIDARDWFWTFMTNLHLDDYRRVTDSDMPIIDDILYTFIWRTYNYNGLGGMFPLRKPSRDQTKIEIWYQFCEYLEDQGLLYELL